ncbi:Uncharacterized protein APZ42_025171 [Daphnia magna]|uniref:Uncharacterized protein n=1 Tax=Daphnia magna TaxID=35525 RepID=A0A164TDP4_9CRUS|nr:Uncharacterized protein APZ42_025171 [Daphnia magna]
MDSCVRMDASKNVDASFIPSINPFLYLESDSGEPPQIEGMDASTRVSVSPLSIIEICSISAWETTGPMEIVSQPQTELHNR